MSETDHHAVYLTCRCSVSYFLALALFHALRAANIDVFLDLDESPTADPEQAGLFAEIDSRSHFLVILTPARLEQYHRTDDRLQQEIDHAAQTHRSIVPMLTNGFNFNSTLIPVEIAFLRRDHALTLTPENVDAAVMQLREQFLTRPVYGEITPLAPDQLERSQRQIDTTAHLSAPSLDILRAEALSNQSYMLARQDYGGKIALCTQALQLDPTHIKARFQRALAHRRNGDERRAIADYDELLHQNPLLYKAFNNRAELHFAFGDFESALSDYDHVLALRPTYAMAQAGKALTLHALEQTDDALQIWQALLNEDQRFYDPGWVGRELRLPPAMIDELHQLALHLHVDDVTPDAPDD